MICIKTEHFKFNRILLLLIGLWPYDRTRLVQFQTIFVFGFLISGVIYLFSSLVVTKCTPALVIHVLSIALFFSSFLFSYNSFWINVHAMKQLLDELQYIFNDLKDENEIAIITKYGNIAKCITALVTLLHVFNVLTIFVGTFLLDLFNANLFEGESESHRLIKKVLPKFLIGHESHTYLIVLYMTTVSSVGGFVMVGIGTMIIAYFKHACGMFKIASYRIEKAMMATMMKNKFLIYREIVHAVDIHCKAIKFYEVVFSTFKGLKFSLIVFNVICLSFNLYRISETLLREGDFKQCYVHLLISFAIFIILFFVNYLGQDITEHDNHVSLTAYNVQWYLAPLHIQKLILFLLQNGSKTICPSIGGMFSLSFELFATLIKTSLSYVTVVYSMQE